MRRTSSGMKWFHSYCLLLENVCRIHWGLAHLSLCSGMRVCELARANLNEAQRRMKAWYDSGAQSRSFSPGEKVMVFLPVPWQSLKACYFGPCIVEKKLSDLNYVIQTPGKRKQSRLCHMKDETRYLLENGIIETCECLEFPMYTSTQG
ncbi:uncharacterized protein LOC119585534 [Penaeus monodon]|uniref:uncharacterized protein LOC119585534 n=1 Tax=Penaeus monodon TaxID=6687 RepID=UPI0018A7271A|nr:uncharacterized protein LOC119585534 [Penaeus monodon]